MCPYGASFFCNARILLLTRDQFYIYTAYVSIHIGIQFLIIHLENACYNALLEHQDSVFVWYLY
jgi:hypothetical protein